MLDTLSKEGAAFLNIYAEDPENLKDADPDRIKRAQISAGKALEAYRIRQMRPVAPSLTIRVRVPRNFSRTSSGRRISFAVSPSCSRS